VIAAGQILVLLALALFIAVGLDPAVAWLHRHGVPRWLAVVIVLIGSLDSLPASWRWRSRCSSTQASAFAHELPTTSGYSRTTTPRWESSTARFHIVTSLQRLVNGGASSALAGGVLGVGKAILDAVASAAIVVMVSIYLLADLPRVKRGHLTTCPTNPASADGAAPPTRSSTASADSVLGNLFTSLIAGIGTWAWALAFGIPYALLLSLLVAILDLIPVVGSNDRRHHRGARPALTISPGVAIATGGCSTSSTASSRTIG